MKRLIPFLFCWAALTACASGVQADRRVVGRFKAAGGEVVEICTNGHIYLHEGRQILPVGMFVIVAEKPLTLRVTAPESAPLVGTTMIFSADHRDIFVKWWSWQRDSRSSGRPNAFKKE